MKVYLIDNEINELFLELKRGEMYLLELFEAFKTAGFEIMLVQVWWDKACLLE